MRALPLSLLALCAGCGPLYLRTSKVEFLSDSALSARSGSWRAVDVPDAPSPPKVWMQQAAGPEEQFNLALDQDSTPLSADVRVQLRAVEGKLDQGGGIVWRAQNERNYYLARWNPLEGDVRVFKVVDGARTELRQKKLAAGPGWHTLRVWFTRDQIEVWFDKQSLGEFGDKTFATAGLVGLWTKADAQTQFDDLEIWEM